MVKHSFIKVLFAALHHCAAGACTALIPGSAVVECAAIFLPIGSSGKAEASYSVSAE